MFKFIVLSENKPGVLYRIADIFLRRKINIQELCVKEIEDNLSRFRILADLDDEKQAEIVRRQIERIIEVFEAKKSKTDFKSLT